jgi:integrase
MEQTALTVGETASLEWGDVDLAESRFRLRRRNVKRSLSARARTVQVPGWLMDAIAATCPLEDRTAERRVFLGCTTGAMQAAMGREHARRPASPTSRLTTCGTGA